MSKFVPQVPLYLNELKGTVKDAGFLIKNTGEWIKNVIINGNMTTNERALLVNEFAWCIRKKPFFNLHQSVIDCISNTTLDVKPYQIPVSVLHEIKNIAVKLPLTCRTPCLVGVTHFMICLTQYTLDSKSSVKQGMGVSFQYQTEKSVFCFGCPWDKTFKECDTEYRAAPVLESEIENDRHSLIARLAIGVMMLASDPDYIDPILLARDKGKTLNEEQHAKAVDRAKRNGVFGFDIGARLEVSPHMRRPHFAIRWTGKNAAIPQLVPIKASIVNKRKLTEVPTGYEVAN